MKKSPTTARTVPQWDKFEAVLLGPSSGNPFTEVHLHATFFFGSREFVVPGFYDGEGTYRIRFMPDTTGSWRMRTTSNVAELDGKEQSFECVAARAGMHGPVRVKNQFHFAHADGTPYFPFGTTCYAWTHQPLEMQEQTLLTLKATRFNKLRMAVFPKH